ncbi:MAG: hypothetical protein WDM89_13205 [Rhizomicrobium sp.]
MLLATTLRRRTRAGENQHRGRIDGGAAYRAPHSRRRAVVEAILRLVRAARPDNDGLKDIRDYIAWGPGPRASQAFMLAVRARALIDGRLAPSTDDVVALAHPILRHRMALSFTARAEGMTLTTVIDRLCRELSLTQSLFSGARASLQDEAEELSSRCRR